ncbi:hypothetical protein OUZ56_006654 [Daphnia magna]|uniref:Uncharacterized protein n=1 Tax=Daphnia magna TaxID=35525 RepID=A0ABQ9YWA8_9CRUS|nr:hypothetical protein OUZ56_006654 [Daphnia magna]
MSTEWTGLINPSYLFTARVMTNCEREVGPKLGNRIFDYYAGCWKNCVFFSVFGKFCPSDSTTKYVQHQHFISFSLT